MLTFKSSKSLSSHDLQILPLSISASDVENQSSSADFTMLVSLVKPLSQGLLQLHSKNPSAAPKINIGYFTYPDDMPRMINAIRVARTLAQTPPLSGLLRREMFPGTRVVSAIGLQSAVLNAVGTYHHPVGTCRMGPTTDRMAVVNSRGGVHGFEGLSIADASIMPRISTANTNLPTIMMAEHCLDWLQ